MGVRWFEHPQAPSEGGGNTLEEFFMFRLLD